MNPFVRPRYGVWSALMLSLAFNAGFGTTLAVRKYQQGQVTDASSVAASYHGLHQKLNLTPEQETHLTAARETLLRQVDELQAELSAERETLAQLLVSAKPNRTAVMAQLEKIASLQQAVQRHVVVHLLEGKELLGPEQRRIFDRIIHLCVCPHGGHEAACVPGCQTPGMMGDGDAELSNGTGDP